MANPTGASAANDPTKTAKGTDCPTPGWHRYDANGRCEWCDAERRFHLHIDGVPSAFVFGSTGGGKTPAVLLYGLVRGEPQ